MMSGENNFTFTQVGQCRTPFLCSWIRYLTSEEFAENYLDVTLYVVYQ
jgi:hypothetical protein